MDKLLVALISAPIGAFFGFLGGGLSEYIRRRLARLERLEEQADEFGGDLIDLARAYEHGQRPERSEVRGLIRARHQLGTDLTRLYSKGAHWARIASALELVDNCLEILEAVSLSQGQISFEHCPAEDAVSQLDAAVRSANRSDPIWTIWKAR